MADVLMVDQAVTALAALLFFGWLVVSLVQRQSARYMSLLLRVGLVPAAAFAWYALFPHDLVFDAITGIGLGLLGAGLIVGIYNQRGARAVLRRPVTSPRLLTRQVQVFVIAMYIITFGMSCVLWMFEPAFAIANVALSLVWAAAWIPGRFRHASSVASVEVDADPSYAWDYIVDPANQADYQGNSMSYSVEPPGPLRRGSAITVRQLVPLRQPVAGMKEFTVESRYLITEFLPVSTFTTSALETQAITRTELTTNGAGTRITVSSFVGCSVLTGLEGSALELKRSMRQSLAHQQSSLATLKARLASTS